MANLSPSYYPDVGVLGEELVSQWLRCTSWIILYRRWRCRWGEIDIIATQPVEQQPTRQAQSCLAFVEVKTRSRGNWDAGGLLSITPQKRRKLSQTARYFLATHSNFADYPCRFDVAVVGCKRLSTKPSHDSVETPITVATSAESFILPVQLGQAVSVAGYQLILQDYIPSAFD